MLKRSPRSQATTIALIVVGVIAAYIATSSLLTMKSLATKHGDRTTYWQLKHTVVKGSPLDESDFEKHTMFSNDAPKDAIRTPEKISGYSKYDIVKGSIATTSMFTKKAIETIADYSRIVFIPSEDKLAEDFSQFTDLISASPDGYGATIVASNARILFGLTPSQDSNGTSQNGYFVEVNEDEALEIAQALSQGDIRFALRDTAD